MNAGPHNAIHIVDNLSLGDCSEFAMSLLVSPFPISVHRRISTAS